ncbi:MAG: CHASE2 domain-containing protein [Candidatus Eisenbacteria sp.]|nr:CHASE2 domain-containing protein [Candidatus Eisenbacteria bacterium]
MISQVQYDSDGVFRRFAPDPTWADLGFKTVPEVLARRRVENPMPVVFPSRDRPIPVLSYVDLLRGKAAALEAVGGKTVFVGLVDDPHTDFVPVPRQQRLHNGQIAWGLPGVVVLAAITETLMRDAPLRDASWPATLAWNVLFCALMMLLPPPRMPRLSLLAVLGVTALALTCTGVLYVYLGLILPGGTPPGLPASLRPASDRLHPRRNAGSPAR